MITKAEMTVVEEVLTAAFREMVADQREINRMAAWNMAYAIASRCMALLAVVLIFAI